jgi:uncharacterized protein
MQALISLPARRPAVILLLASMLTLLAVSITVMRLRLDTDPARMLDPELPYLQERQRYLDAFPMFDRLLVAVVTAPEASRAEDAAARLAARLGVAGGAFRSVNHAGQDREFRDQGLLYLDEDELWDLDRRLAAASPFLGAVAGDPSLRGLLKLLETGLDNELEASEAAELAKLYDRVRRSAEEDLAGRSPRIAWRDELFPRDAGSDGLYREYVLLQPQVDFSQLESAGKPLAIARREGMRIEEEFPQVKVRYTGPVALDDEELAAVAASAGLTTSLSLLLVLGFLVWGLASVGLVAAVLVNLLVGLALTTAFATLAVGSLNLITVNFAVLFIGMGVDFGIQYALRFRELEGLRRLDRLTETSRGVSGALWLAALAAAVSFLAFTPTSYRGLAELGLIAAAGMFIAFATTLLLLPAMLRFLPSTKNIVAQRQAQEAQRANHEALTGQQRRVRADLRERAAIPIVLAAATVTAAGLALLPAVEFDFNPLNLKDPAAPSVQAYQSLLADPNSTPYTAQVLAESLEQARALLPALKALPGVEKVVWVESFVPAAQDAKLDIIDGMRLALDPVFMESPEPPPANAEKQQLLGDFGLRLQAEHASIDDPALARAARRLGDALVRLSTATARNAQRLEAFEAGVVDDLVRSLERLRQLLDTAPISLDELSDGLRNRYLASDGTVRLEVYPRENLADNRELARFVTSLRAVVPGVTGTPVGIYAGGEAVISATVQATALALLASFLLFRLWLHNTRDALLVLVPLLLGLVAMAGSSVALNLPFNLANIIALPLLIGLNNAYGAYLVLRAREIGARRLLRSQTPRAVLLSGLTTAGSFATLSLASHPGMATMGMFIGLAIVWSLFFAVLVLPTLMLQLETTRGG